MCGATSRVPLSAARCKYVNILLVSKVFVYKCKKKILIVLYCIDRLCVQHVRACALE
jgi:hypothetical protein